MAAGIFVCALWTVRQGRMPKPGVIALCIGLVVLTCLAQLVAIPREALARVSPGAAQFLANRLIVACA